MFFCMLMQNFDLTLISGGGFFVVLKLLSLDTCVLALRLVEA